ncbi:acyl-CoA N-acyltransferase [Gautieria morchelliformis]|nr:acyl-CoA N-acyltransferase [Gautieria morchelliformis]
MSKAFKRAKKASGAALFKALQPQPTKQLQSKKYSVTILKASELASALKEAVWNLFRANMEGWYLSTDVFDWDPVEKRAELFHRDSRFLLVVPDSGELEGDLVAYSMFRFDAEEDMQGRDEYVLYWHVTESCRGLGMGKWLVEMLEKIAREWCMSKIMLTVLKANVAAARFYKREGFATDEISPEDEEYLILSKATQIITD